MITVCRTDRYSIKFEFDLKGAEELLGAFTRFDTPIVLVNQRLFKRKPPFAFDSLILEVRVDIIPSLQFYSDRIIFIIEEDVLSLIIQRLKETKANGWFFPAEIDEFQLKKGRADVYFCFIKSLEAPSQAS